MDRIPVEARFSAPVQTGPGAHPASCTMGTGSFPAVKRPGRGVDHPRPSKCRGHERVGLYLYSPSGPSWPVIGRTFTFRENPALRHPNSLCSSRSVRRYVSRPQKQIQVKFSFIYTECNCEIFRNFQWPYGGANGGDLRHGTCGRKRRLHIEIGIYTAAWKADNPRSPTSEISAFFLTVRFLCIQIY